MQLKVRRKRKFQTDFSTVDSLNIQRAEVDTKRYRSNIFLRFYNTYFFFVVRFYSNLHREQTRSIVQADL